MEDANLDNTESFFENAIQFSKHIEMISNEKDQDVLETLVEFIEEHDIEPEKIKGLISESLKDKLKVEFMSRGMLKRVDNLTDFFV